MGTGSYSATANNMKLVQWPLTAALLVQQGGAWAQPQPTQTPKKLGKTGLPEIYPKLSLLSVSSLCVILCA